MQNIYDEIKHGLHFNKFVVDELLFVEYTCPIDQKEIGLWSQADCIIHVLEGKKIWKTEDQQFEANKGDTIYIKKGAYIVEQFFDHDFCMLGFFVNDDFVKNVLVDIEGRIPINRGKQYSEFSLKRINHDAILDGFINSMYSFFTSKEPPSKTLLELKLKELIINVITTDINPELSAYLQSLIEGEDSLRYVMENNFMYSLALNDYAKLCNQSLSSFKRNFQSTFEMTPGKWLTNKRLEFAADQIIKTLDNISQIAYSSGFEDVSHFSYAFKSKFGLSPVAFRQKFELKP